MTFEAKDWQGGGAMKFWLLALSFQRLVGVFFLKANSKWLKAKTSFVSILLHPLKNLVWSYYRSD